MKEKPVNGILNDCMSRVTLYTPASDASGLHLRMDAKVHFPVKQTKIKTVLALPGVLTSMELCNKD